LWCPPIEIQKTATKKLNIHLQHYIQYILYSSWDNIISRETVYGFLEEARILFLAIKTRLALAPLSFLSTGEPRLFVYA
jgi:hypothetical protein